MAIDPEDLGSREPRLNGHASSQHANVAPLAVIGLSCRFPGSATSPEKLWDMLAGVRSAWTSKANVNGRFNMENFYHPEIGRPGTIFQEGTHLLKEGIAAFDRNFFNINATEARSMDPQIRHLLEIAFETFENAGYSMDQMAGSETGVYVGSWSHDYGVHLSRDPDNAPVYESTGNTGAIVSNRVSHFYDLRGPSLTIDTACSASLVALHQAVLSLRSGETKQCFVAGVNLIVDPTNYMALGKMRLLSPAGRCFAFDSRASGYGRGEGVGGVLIKPLDAAIRDGDNIRAIIRNTAVNQDGKTPGITVPSAAAQEAAILRAYSQAGLELDADYVEAHGTGTGVGDPIETKAIAAALASHRTKEDPLIIGSMKSNIGHLEAAAGLASLIKSILMLEKGAIPPNANLKSVNEKLHLDDLNLKVADKFQTCKDLRRISVNGFGFGGTNAHVVLEKGTSDPFRSLIGITNGHSNGDVTEALVPEKKDHFFVLSGDTQKVCRQSAVDLLRYASELLASGRLDRLLPDLAYSLSRRSVLKYRIAFTCHDGEELITKLESIQGSYLEPQLSILNPRLAFIFTGQGAQWYGMGRELLENSIAFGNAIDRASKTMIQEGCVWDLRTELLRSKETSGTDRPDIGQPLCTAVQLSLVDTLASLGIRPTAVVGHSSGEIAAAYAAGALSFEDAIVVSYHRGRLVAENNKASQVEGAMLAVGGSADKVAEFIANVPSEFGSMVVACVNSPQSVTVSGDKTAVVKLHQNLDEEGIFNRLLKTNGAAYHSHHMRPIAQQYLDSISHVKERLPDPSVRWVSSVTNAEMGSQVLRPSYWIENLVSPVLFSQALSMTCIDQSLADPQLIDTIVEIGPHSTLAGPTKQILKSLGGPAQGVVYSSPLIREKNAITTFLHTLGALHVRGHPVNLRVRSVLFGEPQGRVLPDLPTYPWDHDTKYWSESRISLEYRSRKFPYHELLGTRTSDFNPMEPSWRNYLRLNEIPWIKGHEVNGQVVWPAAAYVSMALEAARQHALSHDASRMPSTYLLRDVVFSKALIVDSNANDLEIYFTLRPFPQTARDSSTVWDEFRVFSITDKVRWNEHCRGLISVELGEQGGRAKSSHSESLSIIGPEIKAQSRTKITPERFYGSYKSVGMNWHDTFANLTDLSASPSTAFCKLRPIPTCRSPAADNEIPYVIHPGTLDTFFQAGMAPMMVDGRKSLTTHVVTLIENLSISPNYDHDGTDEVSFYCQSSPTGHLIATVPSDANSTAPFTLSIDRYQLTAVPQEISSDLEDKPYCATLIWEPVSPGKEPAISQTNNEANGTGHVNGTTHANGTARVNGTEKVNGTKHLNSNGLSNGTSQHFIQLVQCSLSKEETELASTIERNFLHADVRCSSLEDSVSAGNICVLLSLNGQSFLSDLHESQFNSIKDMVMNARGILWVTAGGVMDCPNPSAATVSGFARTLRVEDPDLRLVTLDLDPSDLNSEHATDVISSFLKGPWFDAEENITGLDFEYAERKGQLHVARVVDNDEVSQFLQQADNPAEASPGPYFQEGRSLILEAGQPGLLDTLRWVDDTKTTHKIGPDEVALEARAHGVNFRDLLVAIGQLGQNASMAGECSGIVTAVGTNLKDDFAVGDRVCAFGAQPYASNPVVKGQTCYKIPDDMTFETAASIPIVGATVVYALIHLGKLQKGQKVLIHSATGGVGQAAVMLAHHLGAEVFATVGTEEKKQFIIDNFGVAPDHIFSSRTTAFRDGILNMTQNEGVDVVLNSLTGEMFRESCNCMAHFGRFIDIGKRHLQMNAKMDMGFFLKNVQFTSVDLMIVGQRLPELTKQLMQEAVELVSSGKVRPIKITSAPLHEVQNVFRQMQAGKHMGKLVLTADRDTQVKVIPPPLRTAQFNDDSSYLIIGGLGGLGQKLISWMADHGVKHVLTLSRSGMSSPQARDVVDDMKARGVTLTVLPCDVADQEGLKSALASVSDRIPPIRGVIHAAMVLQDSIFENMTYGQWVAATRPKIQGAANLHRLLTEPLDFFIMLSSVVSVVGNAGQAAYVAANSYLDGLARNRTASGLAARSINVGVVRDAGFVSDEAQVAATLSARGFATISVNELFAMIDYAITHPRAATPELSQTCMGLGTSTDLLKDAKFKGWLEVHRRDAAAATEVGAVNGTDSYLRAIQSATSTEDASKLICDAIVQQWSKLLSVPANTIDPKLSLTKYGVDSLISVEFRNWIRADLKASVQLLEINDATLSIRNLAGLVAQRSKLISGS